MADSISNKGSTLCVVQRVKVDHCFSLHTNCKTINSDFSQCLILFGEDYISFSFCMPFDTCT